MPAAPPPPGLLTSATGTGTSFSSVMILWITRASRSAPPPTANGITNSTSLVGFQPCASAAHGNAASTRSLKKKRIGFSLLRRKMLFGRTILGPMGMLVEGVWREVPRDTKSTGGAFVRPESAFRERVTDVEPGRYRLYVSKSCPWAHRTLIVRAMKGLEKAIAVHYADPYMGEHGWEFPEGYLYEVYIRAQPGYTGRVTVPVLWDEKAQRIVNNESSEIIRMLNREFDPLARRKLADLYPEKLRREIDWLNERIYRTVNNGVY